VEDQEESRPGALAQANATPDEALFKERQPNNWRGGQPLFLSSILQAHRNVCLTVFGMAVDLLEALFGRGPALDLPVKGSEATLKLIAGILIWLDICPNTVMLISVLSIAR
jgi:hypothetical protein